MCGDQHARPVGGDQALSTEQVLTIFKMYEDKGWAVKLQMLTVVTWLAPVVFGLLAFGVTESPSHHWTSPAKIAAATAVALSLFMSGLVVVSLSHANSDYARAHRVLEHARDKHLLSDDALTLLTDDATGVPPARLPYVGTQFKAIMVFSWLLFLATCVVAILV